MESKYVKLTVPATLYNEGLRLVDEFGYSNIQDLTIESLRKQIMELKREQVLVNLRKNFGSAKSKKIPTKKERDMIARQHTPKRAREITKRFGLEDIKI